MLNTLVRSHSIGLVILLAALVAPVSAQIEEVQAFSGQPFGVGRISLRLAPGARLDSASDPGLELADKDGRAFYPAFSAGPLGGVVRELLARPRRITIYFLFQGDRPLRLSIQNSGYPPLAVEPDKNDVAHAQLLNLWWREYTAPARRLVQSDDQPRDVENYLTAMLARRLHLKAPAQRHSWLGEDDLGHALGLVLGTDSLRLGIERDLFEQEAAAPEVADQSLPEAIAPPALAIPEPDKKVAVEPIALHVPAECFYLRCGSFANYQWFRSTLDRWGGDLRNLIAVRGLDYGMQARLESQLVLRERVLAKLLGNQVIADVAIIGSDTFTREGAAIGILFQARSNTLLAADINEQRSDALKERKGATERKVQIAGHSVSFLSTPGNAVRSFYATDGDFHLVTTSETMVRRFLEAGQGKESLGASREFRHIRTLMPIARDDTIFLYLSDAFFRQMVGPRYRVEMARRLRAAAELQLVELARLTAKAEGRPAETLEQLVAAGALPPSVGRRLDGSRLQLAAGGATDSLRGARGTFVPVNDVAIERITAAEAQAYRDFAAYYQDKWERVDPVAVGIRRQASKDGARDHVVLDVRMTPLARRRAEFFAEKLGLPETRRLAAVPGDLVAGEAVLRDSRLFFAVRDFQVPPDIASLLVPLVAFQDLFSLKGHLGSWPTPGWLAFLDPPGPMPTDDQGYTLLPTGAWRRQVARFSVWSFQRDVLETVTPRLKFADTLRPGQVWLRVADPAGTTLAERLDALSYGRAQRIDAGNIRFLRSLAQQLRVPVEQTREVAERTLDAKLSSPRGGDYQFQRGDRGPDAWIVTPPPNVTSSEGREGAPGAYHIPLLRWFRGLDADLSMGDGALSAHAEIEMEVAGGKP
ncbi:MAG: hypothetical protein ACYC35_05475 [Pirellulales bacterium]